MDLFKITWKENGSSKTIAVLAYDALQALKRMDGFTINNLESMEKIHVGCEIIIAKKGSNED